MNRSIRALSIAIIALIIVAFVWLRPKPAEGPAPVLPSATGDRIDQSSEKEPVRPEDSPPEPVPAGEVVVELPAPNGPAAAIKRLLAEPYGVDRAALRQLLASLSGDELSELADSFKQAMEGQPDSEAWQDYLAAWARQHAAAAYFYSVEEKLGASARHAVLQVWAERDPAKLKKFLEASATSEDADFHALRAIPALLEQHPVETLAWIDDLPENQLKARGLELAAKRLAKAHEEASFAIGADLLTKYANNPALGTAAIREFASEWAGVDHEAAWNWTYNLPSGAVRTAALRDLTQRWAGGDPQAAGEWINQQANDPAIDPSVAAFAETFASEDPESAMSWATSIHDPTLREATENSIYESWLRQAPAEANAWKQGSATTSE